MVLSNAKRIIDGRAAWLWSDKWSRNAPNRHRPQNHHHHLAAAFGNDACKYKWLVIEKSTLTDCQSRRRTTKSHFQIVTTVTNNDQLQRISKNVCFTYLCRCDGQYRRDTMSKAVLLTFSELWLKVYVVVLRYNYSSKLGMRVLIYLISKTYEGLLKAFYFCCQFFNTSESFLGELTFGLFKRWTAWYFSPKHLCFGNWILLIGRFCRLKDLTKTKVTELSKSWKISIGNWALLSAKSQLNFSAKSQFNFSAKNVSKPMPFN